MGVIRDCEVYWNRDHDLQRRRVYPELDRILRTRVGQFFVSVFPLPRSRTHLKCRYKWDYYGLTALQTGVLVAFTQLIPEHQLQFFGSLRIRVKRLPMIYVTISNVLCLIGYQSPWLLIQFGWLFSWAYLRFYKRTTDALSGIDTYGDRSETFAFIHWFPPFVQ